MDFPQFHENSIIWRSVAQKGPNRSLERGGQYLSLAQFSSSEDLYLRSYGRLKLSEKIEKNLKSSLKQILLRSPRNRNLRKNSWCLKKKSCQTDMFVIAEGKSTQEIAFVNEKVRQIVIR